MMSKRWSLGVSGVFNYIVLDKDKTDESFNFEDYKKDVSALQYFGFRVGLTYHRSSK